MSVPATGGTPTAGAGEEAIEIPRSGDAAFGALMDALAPEPEAPAGAPAAGDAGGAPAAAAGGADPAGAGAAAAGSAAAAGDGKAAGDGQAAAPADAQAGSGADGAAAGDPAEPAATAGAGDRPADWTADATAVIPKLGELSTKLEESTTQAYQAKALEEVRGEYGQYFTALQQHPRLLVGQQVPAIGKEGMETLRDTNDAREWQDAVKSILASEVRDRASRAMDESKDFLQTVHASIELFQNNADLVPGTKGFDVELANRFAAMAKPYELRVDGKLHGYSIPVQPLVEQLRTQLASERAAKPTSQSAPAAPATPPGGAAGAPPPAAVTPPAEPPQAGISSKAGNGSNSEDFSTLFGTIGLPNLQI